MTALRNIAAFAIAFSLIGLAGWGWTVVCRMWPDVALGIIIAVLWLMASVPLAIFIGKWIKHCSETRA